MERSHPNSRRVMFALRVVLILAAAGCSNRQMSASNPFMSPDRVPPPATRTIAPGTAAPYYPGDPMPAAQVPPAPAGAPQFAQPQQPGMPGMQMPSPPVAAAPQPLEFTNERNVSIPSDGQDLRFAVPPPPVTPVQPQAVPIQQAAAPTAVPQQVMPAAYNQPMASQPAPAASLVPTATADDAVDGPWRSPQVPNKPSPVMQAQYVQPSPYQATPQPQLQPQLQAVPQAAPAAATTPVQLRAVPPSSTAPMMTAQPQPQVAPAPTPPPRMRFPSWTEPSTWFTPQPAEAGPPPGQQLVGYMVPGPNGQMQMVSVEQMQAMSTGAAQPAPSVATADGFRPRGSATK